MMMMKFALMSAIVMCYVTSNNAVTYEGCYDNAANTILEGGKITASDMTIEKCVHHCTLYKFNYAGLEAGNTCLCGKYWESTTKEADTVCSTNCAGDATQKCGGTSKTSVYTTKSNYVGCFEDKSTRILEGNVITSTTMTTKQCIDNCTAAGKRFALTQYSSQCFCGNHLRKYNKKVDTECDYNCAGNSNEKCGGFWRGSLYRIDYNTL